LIDLGKEERLQQQEFNRNVLQLVSRSMIPATESRRVLQENTGNHWNMEEVFQPEFVRIF
jgi:hypothetical protein